MEETKEEKKETIRDIYGSFSIGATEFAISVKSIQEVVNEPESYKSVPLSPPFLLGLFNLRGMVVPVVDLRKVFDIEETKEVKEKKVAIIEHGKLCVGILFGKTGEVFNANDEEKSEFEKKTDSVKECIVSGVFKMDEGKRIVQILDPYEVLNLEKIPRTERQSIIDSRNQNRGKRRQCISFNVGDNLCAFDIEAIQEIVSVDQIDNTVLSGEMCLGAINLRGTTIPVIDFQNLLGYEKNQREGAGKRIIVMKINDDLFGLPVHSVANIMSFYNDELVEFPVLGDKRKSMFAGCITTGDQIETILLNHEKILTHQEIEEITKGHSRLYQDHSEEERKVEASNNEASKKTFITFSIHDHYALEIDEVKEVLDFPEEIITPPKLPTFFTGMFNLRGELVAIIDPRLIYNIHQDREVKEEKRKILIFTAEGTQYGLIVDSVDSIVSFTDRNSIKLPNLMYKGPAGSITDDVKDAIQVDHVEDKSSTTLLVLNIDALTSRIQRSVAA